MKMNRLIGKSLIVAALASISATAFAAAQDTSYFYIGRLDGSAASANGFRIYPQDYALPTSQNCSKSDFAEIQTLAPLTGERAIMNKLVMAAFTAGRKVKLRLDGCGESGRPAYTIVTLDAAQ
jgi:hypothetical protein